MNSNFDIIRYLVENKANIHNNNNNNNNIIDDINDDIKIIKNLIIYSSNINVLNNVLKYFAINNNLELVKFLIEECDVHIDSDFIVDWTHVGEVRNYLTYKK